MPEPIVECIPNYSEGRDETVIKQILNEITSIAKVQILDYHLDPDHNRTVVTIVGSPEEMEEAIFRSIKKAAELINLDNHRGSHPRLGATDVVPFVPISGLTIKDCIKLSHRLAKRVGEELSIPVYLYEEAALLPERKNLEKIRKGEYELLKQEIETNPERKPDFGPSSLTPAGATVMGARAPLVAFNVYLDTDDLFKAKSIAQSIRESSGGFPKVKALGMLVDGYAQVSMNLTDYTITPIIKVFDAIISLSSKFNVKIHHSEIVGLLPQAALTETAINYLKLTGFKKDQILEYKLSQFPQPATFLEKLASSNPTPGGGSAAAYTGAMSAALIAMVANLTIGKKKYSQVEPQMQELLALGEKLRLQLQDLVEADSRSFESVMAAFKLPKNSPELKHFRISEIENAFHQAALIPIKVAQSSLTLLAAADQVAKLGNQNALSDAGSAGNLAIASINSALLNVKINLQNLSDKHTIDMLQSQVDLIEQRLDNLKTQLLQTLKSKGL